MDLMYVLIIMLVCGSIIFYAQRVKHKKELADLARESSERVQKYHSKLVKVCTEPESMEAKLIIHEVTFDVEKEKVLLFGELGVAHNGKGIWAKLEEQKGGFKV